MEKILRRLENERIKFINRKTDSEYDSLDKYLEENKKLYKFDIKDYNYILNCLIIFKLMKNFSAVPNMIIDFCNNPYKNIKDNFEIKYNYDNPKYMYYDHLIYDIKTYYIDEEYGNFIPSKETLENLLKFIKNKKISILSDNDNFLKYILKNNGIIDIVNYYNNDKFDVIIIYQEKIDDVDYDYLIKNNITTIIIKKSTRPFIDIDNMLYDYNKPIILDNNSILSNYNSILIYIKEKEDKLIKTYTKELNNEEKKIYDYYLNSKKLYGNNHNNLIKLIVPLIQYKYHKNEKNIINKILEYISNSCYPLFKKNIEDKYDTSNLFYNFNYYISHEYSVYIPTLDNMKKIADFIGNMKVLQINDLVVNRDTNFWIFLFRSYGIKIEKNIKILNENLYPVQQSWINIPKTFSKKLIKDFDILLFFNYINSEIIEHNKDILEDKYLMYVGIDNKYYNKLYNLIDKYNIINFLNNKNEDYNLYIYKLK